MTAVQRTLIELLLAALAGLGLFALGHHGGLVAGRAQVQAKWDAERAAQTTAALAATTAARAEEARRRAAQTEIDHVASLALAHHDADLRAAAGAHQRLLDAAHAAADRSAGAADPAPVGSGFRAQPTGHLLADVLGRVDDAAGVIADFADRLSIALDACTTQYTSLTAQH